MPKVANAHVLIIKITVNTDSMEGIIVSDFYQKYIVTQEQLNKLEFLDSCEFVQLDHEINLLQTIHYLYCKSYPAKVEDDVEHIQKYQSSSFSLANLLKFVSHIDPITQTINVWDALVGDRIDPKLTAAITKAKDDKKGINSKIVSMIIDFNKKNHRYLILPKTKILAGWAQDMDDEYFDFYKFMMAVIYFYTSKSIKKIVKNLDLNDRKDGQYTTGELLYHAYKIHGFDKCIEIFGERECGRSLLWGAPKEEYKTIISHLNKNKIRYSDPSIYSSRS